MKMVLNEEKEFPILRAGENYTFNNGIINKFLQVSLLDDNNIFNEFLNFINTTLITKIELIDNFDKKIYSTTELINPTDIYKNFNGNKDNNISISFVNK